MIQPSNEQHEKLGKAIRETCQPSSWSDLTLGRTAWDACLPIILAEPDAAEVLAFRTKHPRMPDPIGANFACFIGFRREYMTAKPDPAVEAILELCRITFRGPHGTGNVPPYISPEFAERIVAAVDDARKK